MQKEPYLPSQTFNEYWIYATNKTNNYHIPRKESGKWLFFEHIDDLDETWIKIKTATENGHFGRNAKTSTAKPNPNAANHDDIKVICVYTADIAKEADVQRIADNIRKLGIDNKLIYKLDRDVGKYSKDGYQDLSQKVLFSKKYYDTVAWLEQYPQTKYLQYLGTRNHRKRYQFQRLDMAVVEYRQRLNTFRKLGFLIEDRGSIEDEKILFSHNSYK